MPVQYSYTSTPPMGRTACTEPQCLYSTAITLLPLWAVRTVQSLSACTVQLYLYSLYGPYGLYRASVPVEYSYTSTPLWAVQPVQSLSACTRVHFTLTSSSKINHNIILLTTKILVCFKKKDRLAHVYRQRTQNSPFRIL